MDTSGIPHSSVSGQILEKLRTILSASAALFVKW